MNRKTYRRATDFNHPQGHRDRYAYTFGKRWARHRKDGRKESFATWMWLRTYS